MINFPPIKIEFLAQNIDFLPQNIEFLSQKNDFHPLKNYCLPQIKKKINPIFKIKSVDWTPVFLGWICLEASIPCIC